MTEEGTAIGILDSGVGGLSVMKEIHSLLPCHQIHYIADSAWCPYGNKSPAEIQERVFLLTDKLISKGCGIVVIACNSATISAVEALRANYPIPFTGMEPAIKPASKITKTGVIGVLATEASLAGEKFHQLLHTHGSGIKIITTPCPKFVEHVEQGDLDGSQVEASIREYTQHMLDASADTLVLGCTHYPFLRRTIQQVVGENIKLIDTGAAVAKQTKNLLERNYPTTKANHYPSPQIYTTGDLHLLEKIFPRLCPNINATLKELN